MHYVPPITSNSGSVQDQYIYLSTPSEADVDYDIQIIGGSTISGTINNTKSYTYPIGSGDNTQLKANKKIQQATKVDPQDPTSDSKESWVSSIPSAVPAP